MAKSNFNVDSFLKRIAAKTDIFTGGANDHNIPSNVGQEEYDRLKLDSQNQRLNEISTLPPSQIRDTNNVMVGGAMADSSNYRPPVEAPNVGALNMSQKAPVPTEGGALPPPPEYTPQQGEPITTPAPTQEDLAVQSQVGNVDPVAAQEEKAAQILEMAPDPENPTGNYVEDKMKSLGDMFKERMTKVEKANFNKLSDEDAREVRLRFFLALMEEGGKKNGKGLIGNIGTAGRTALDARRIIRDKNNINEQKRHAMDAKRVFDEMSFEIKDRQNARMKKRWEASIERVKAGLLIPGVDPDGNMIIVDKNNPDQAKPVLYNGKPVPADKGARSGSQPKEITILDRYLGKEDAQDPAKFQSGYDKLFGGSKGGRSGKDPNIIPASEIFKGINKSMESSGDYDETPKDPRAITEEMRRRARDSQNISSGKYPEVGYGGKGKNSAAAEWYRGLSPEGQKQAQDLQVAHEEEIKNIPKNLSGLPKARQEIIKRQLREIKERYIEKAKKLK